MHANSQLELGRSVRPLRRIPSQEGTAFHGDGDTAEKRLQRQLILDFLTDQFSSWKKNPKIVTLPGERWQFESMMIEKFPEAFIIGLERDTTTYNRSIQWIPGGRRRAMFRYKMGGVNKYIDCCESGRVRLINVEAAWFFSPSFTPLNWHRKDRWPFIAAFNSVWIDSFSPVGTEAYFSIIRKVASNRRRSAAAFSFMLGRDDSQAMRIIDSCPGDTPLARRASLIEAIVTASGARWTTKHVFEHHSFNADGNVHFGTVCGVVERQKTE